MADLVLVSLRVGNVDEGQRSCWCEVMEVEFRRMENLEEMLNKMLRSTMKEEVGWALAVEWPSYQICRF